jgi:TonB-dependent SusC/RagA subfamily outer membrane receptor
LVLIAVLIAQLSFAQERVVSGVVSDDTGLPLPGASVLIKGTKTGTQTDFDGKYAIKASPSQVLIFSYIGMKNQEITASASKLNVKLASSTVELESVVVTGTAKGRSIKEMTYSIGQVNSAAIEKVPAADALSALQGKVAGLKINSTSGEPGSDVSVLLRSANSLSTGQKPLIILDGVILEGGLADINTLDIDRVEVVKGAAGASLYGSRAASGVIQIFSKRGKGLNGKTRISLRSETGINNITDKLDLTTSHKFKLTPDGADFDYDLTGNKIVDTDNIADNPYPSKYKIYDLQDRIFRPGIFNSHHLAVEGGKDATSFLLSYDRQDSKSIIELTDTYSRNNFRLNLDHKVSDKFKIGSSMTYANSQRDPFVMGQSGICLRTNSQP